MRRWLSIAVLALLVVWAARVDVPHLLGKVKGDEANYISMAFSVAKDFDLKYRPEDYLRFVAVYGTGPEGIFLKRRGSSDTEFEYGKPFAYAVAAAPFAAALGLGGLLLFNILLLTLCVWLAAKFCRARTGSWAGALFGVSFIGASIVPVYGVWLTPEIFNFTLVVVAYFLWLYKELAPPAAPAWLRDPRLDWIAAVLLGIATFSKPPNGALIVPIVLTAVFRAQWRQGVVVSALLVLTTAGMFGMNAWISGEANYQGGEGGSRRYFASHFPFDADLTPFDKGEVMETNQANDRNIFAPDVLVPTLTHNLVYFFVGRDAGLIPYYFPGALVVVLWLTRWRQSTVWQRTTALACLMAILVILVIAPASWNGGGGPVGNRYFLAIYPSLLFLIPAGAGVITAIVAAAGGALFIGALLLHPVAASLAPWTNTEHWPLHELPVELTLIEDLPVRLESSRARVEVSRDPQVFLYYMDSRTYFQEPGGFWVAPGAADIILRTERPLTSLKLDLMSRVANEVEISIGGKSDRELLQPERHKTVQFHPPPGVFARESYQIVLRLKTAAGFYPKQFDVLATDIRHLGVFVTATYEVK